MMKIVPLIPLCLFILMTLGCGSFMKMEGKRPCAPKGSSEEIVSPPKSSGYLTSGSTVILDTGEENKRISLLEQFDQLRKDLAASQGKNASLERELESEKAAKTALESELEEIKSQLEITQQVIIENEKLTKQLEQSLAPYEKKIKELTIELTNAQIEETKTKQALVGMKIEQLVGEKEHISENPH
ncbi:MAG: hypothetical protein QG591_2796 [Planctomycetota bacterium]|nr:hypothetical protein [Planctomycetota bacterium]